MWLVSWIILGLIVGALVKSLMPGRVEGGWFTSLALGVIGAIRDAGKASHARTS